MLEVKTLLLLDRREEAKALGQNAIDNAHLTGLSEQIISQIKQYIQTEAAPPPMPPPSSGSSPDESKYQRGYNDEMTEFPLA